MEALLRERVHPGRPRTYSRSKSSGLLHIMKKSYGYLSCALLVASLGACDEYLNTEPQTILTDEQVWSNPSMILGVMADYYGLLPDYLNFESGLGTWGSHDEGLYSGITNTDQVNGI